MTNPGVLIPTVFLLVMNKYWAAAFFDSREVETINEMAAMARRMLICQRELQRDELARLKMKYPHLTTKD